MTRAVPGVPFARLGMIAAVALTALFMLGPGRAAAQQLQGPIVQFDPNAGVLTYDFSFGQPPRPVTTVFGTGISGNQPYVFVFDPVNPFTAGPGCQLLSPIFTGMVICPTDPTRIQTQFIKSNLALAPGAPNTATYTFVPGHPAVGFTTVEGGTQKDTINDGWFNGPLDYTDTAMPDEQTVTYRLRAGDDEVDPGPGKDNVNTGPGNDKIDSKDGEVDRINGGSGKRDVATVDKKDKVKNVEVVKGK